jgi:hypothetical protein
MTGSVAVEAFGAAGSVRQYVTELAVGLKRKNDWMLDERPGEQAPDGM